MRKVRDTTEAKLKALFDFQKFEQEPKLQSVIDNARSMSKIVPLRDEELTYLAAGVDNSSTYSGNKKCPKCNSGLVFNEKMNWFECPNCGRNDF